MANAKTFKASFRPNLYYEVRTKPKTSSRILFDLLNNIREVGIIYCLRRKKVGAVAEVLQ
jgi:superfamily II DNA helicase RecQ